MRPVTPSKLDDIVGRKEICILSATWFTIQFVSSLVNHSPGNIATKQGNKRLPLELWREIIAWAEMDLKSGNYCLVQVQSLVEHGAKRVLSCAKITEWNRCGLLKTEDAADEYRKYLRCPGEGDDPKRPFVLPDTKNLDSLIKIEESLLGPENEILFTELEVYDVLSWIEDGDCSFCECARWMDMYGEDGGYRFSGYTLPYPTDRWERYLDPTMGCPLCIGLGPRPLYYGPRTPQNDRDDEELEMVQRYDYEVRERFEELGYDWVPSYFYNGY
ncbi:hypothetical protein CEP51_009798 [Fusarium floridanum]|uniref:Uncharacterized protein n=1 Tax=Fusarium floridanum TaxID=1325733 RepID=A0A428RGH4_9HYPO|nr:hypothetical protein CEP51_009798 [Fusarium floridanum]